MRAGAPPRARRLCGVAPSCPHPHRRRCLRDQPAGTETRTALVTRRVRTPRVAPGRSHPVAPGGGAAGGGAGARDFQCPRVPCQMATFGGRRRPLPGPWGRSQPQPQPRLGLGTVGLPRPRLAAPTPSLWLGRTCAHTWAAARSPLSSSHNGAPVPRLEGPWKACDPPLGLASQAPQVPAETRSPSLYSYEIVNS